MSRSHRRIPQRSTNRPTGIVEATYAQELALYQRNQLSQALELCHSKLLKLSPEHPGGVVCAGVICYLNKPDRQAGAMECYRQAIKADRTYANAYNNLGHALDAVDGDKTAAAENFRSAIACDPSYLQPCLNLAGILEKTGEEAEALGCLQKALELQPGNVEIVGHPLLRQLRWCRRLPMRRMDVCVSAICQLISVTIRSRI
ncbi:MAG: tetratricopeptide repeat protein [Stenotrophomonas sp.]|uniref:tetratricopeptide repeat protein n=1 Tax=Stenotrophomonas sp. TaxID=69392 RepID=UPI003D6C9499